MIDERPRASVLVPVWNEEAHLEETLEAILTQRFDRGLEVLVIDGGSTDRTAEIASRFAREDPRVRILANPKQLIPNALNIGLRDARGDYVVRMDAHTHYPPDYIARGVERLEAGGVECVSGPPIPRGINSWSRRVALALGTRVGVGSGMFKRPHEEMEVDTTYTGVWRRSTLAELGGWDEGWPINEDSELCIRIIEAGGKSVAIPSMAANYVPRRSLPALAKQYARYGHYRAKTARHHPLGLRRSHLLAPGVTLAVAAALVPLGTLQRAARRVLPIYAGALAVGTAEAAIKADRADPRDLAWLPAVFAVMHLSWGAGFLVGCLRWGPPLAAIRRVLGYREG